MRNRRKIKWVEVVLLLLPALALVCVGVWLQNRRPFKLIIAQAKLAPPLKGSITKLEPSERGIRVVVFIDHEGAAPSWWGSSVNPTDSRVNFTRQGEKDDPLVNVGGYTGVDFDKSRQQYTFDYWGTIPKNPEFLRNSTCHVSVQLESSSPPIKKLASAKASIPGKQLETIVEWRNV